MKDALIAGLRGSIVILLLTIGCVLAVRLYKAVVPQQVAHDTINITQAEYAQQKAKWEGQKIGAYEVTSSDPDLKVRMRVDRSTDDIFLLQLTARGQDESVDGLNSAVSGVTAAVFTRYTIEGLYARIGDALASVTDSATEVNNAANTSTNFRDYEVQFDPNRGYPLHFTEGIRTTLPSQEITWRTNIMDLQIKDFTVVR